MSPSNGKMAPIMDHTSHLMPVISFGIPALIAYKETARLRAITVMESSVHKYRGL